MTHVDDLVDGPMSQINLTGLGVKISFLFAQLCVGCISIYLIHDQLD